MPKITAEINDTLDERLECAIDELKENLLAYFEENKEIPRDIDQVCDSHELADSAVPCYTSEIDDIWYLNKSSLIEAYEDAGLGDNSMENDGMAAIYAYISQGIHIWYDDELEGFFEEWKEGRLEEFENDIKEKFPIGSLIRVNDDEFILGSIDVLDFDDIIFYNALGDSWGVYSLDEVERV